MEEKDYKTPETQQPDDDIIEIDWMELLRKLWAHRRIVLRAAVIGTVVGVVIALGMPKKYTVSVTLSPESGQAAGGSLSGLASMVGLGVNVSGEDALGAALSADIVASTPFLLELFDMKVQTQEGELDTTLVAYLGEQSASWLGAVLALPGKAVGGLISLFSDEEEAADTLNPFRLSKEQYEQLETLRKAITADVDKKTSKTTIAVTLQDPLVAATVADSVAYKLQEYIIAYRSKKALEDCKYLEMLYRERQTEYYDAQQKYAAYVDANQNVVRRSSKTQEDRLRNDMELAYQVYSQVATQLQVARAKVQEAKPVFAVVEPATVPLLPSSVSRKVVVIGFIFLACAATAAWVLFGAGLWRNFREEMSKPVTE